MSSNIEGIKRKIKSLLSRTTQYGATQAEAETSAKLANELMAKYMIEKHQLQDKEDFRCCEKRVFLSRKNSIVHGLCTIIADSFDCEFLVYRNGGAYFGIEEDLEICTYIHDLIFTALESEIKKYKKTQDYGLLERYYFPVSIIKDFIQGFTYAVAVKLIEYKSLRRDDVMASTGTDLVLVKENIVSQELSKVYPGIKIKSFKKRKVEIYSYLAGVESGQRLQLNSGVKAVTKEALCYG